ncbi:MAG: hypothetical protein WBA93_24450 [Microcoleaceae cyanobacterium]
MRDKVEKMIDENDNRISNIKEMMYEMSSEPLPYTDYPDSDG